MYDAIYIERMGKPVATFVFEPFYNDAMSAASSKGMPVIRVVPEQIVSESTVVNDIRYAIHSVADDMIAVLTGPLTEDEISPRRREPENPPRITFKGNLEEVNRFFYQRGWTDGLPVIPPTEAAVAEMLTGTDLPPDHLVETLVPRLGKATVETIAVNAVMAGCLPTHMPVLIAGVHALTGSASCDMMAASTGSFSPFWLINGPVAKEINVRSTYGATSPGDIANAAIGRAMGLITKNIRGIRKQVEDMGVLGNPGKYSWVAAEAEDESPWPPFHLSHGFAAEDSTVTLTFPQSYQQLMPFGTDDKGLLGTVMGHIGISSLGNLVVLLTPTNARSLADRGWTKQQVMDYIVENTILPEDYFQRLGLADMENAPERGLGTAWSRKVFRRSPSDPSPVHIFVYGGFGSWVGLAYGGPAPITRKIELPANWDSLVKKYRNVVPNYLLY